MKKTQIRFRDELREFIRNHNHDVPDTWLAAKFQCSMPTLYSIYNDIEAGNFRTARLHYILRLERVVRSIVKADETNPVAQLLKRAGWKGE